jgi:hypothetical protein
VAVAKDALLSTTSFLHMEFGALDLNDEVAGTEPFSSEKKRKRPSMLRKIRKSDAEYDSLLSPSVKSRV